MRNPANNFAFIDSQNLNLGIKALGWELDFVRFRVYLRERYGVTTAYLFIGYMPEHQDLYNSLQKAGYVLVFKPILRYKNGDVKGNVDAELVLQAMIDYSSYEQAIIVTSDGDFYCLVKYLYERGKLACVLSPYVRTCSVLLRRAAKERVRFMDNLRKKLEYTKRHRHGTGP